jgi:hypothetical protein
MNHSQNYNQVVNSADFCTQLQGENSMADNEHGIATLPEKKRGSGKSSTFDVGPGLLNFGFLLEAQSENSRKLQALVTNNSNHELMWIVKIRFDSEAEGWLKLGQTFGDVLSGTIQAHAQQLIDVTVDVGKLAEGQNQATLHFTSREEQKEVALSLKVAAEKGRFSVENHGGPKIVNGASLNFGTLKKGSRAIAQLTIANLNSSLLAWSAVFKNETSPGNWLQMSPVVSPIPASSSEPLAVTVITNNLTAGRTYTAVLEVTSVAGNHLAPISVAVS